MRADGGAAKVVRLRPVPIKGPKSNLIAKELASNLLAMASNLVAGGWLVDGVQD